MVHVKVVLFGGVLLLFAGFGLGTQPRSVSLDDETYSCGAAILSSWLVPGTPDRSLSAGSSATPEQRRAAGACSAVIHQTRVVDFSAMGLGAVLALLGWAAIRERREPELRQVVASHP